MAIIWAKQFNIVHKQQGISIVCNYYFCKLIHEIVNVKAYDYWLYDKYQVT